MPARILTALPVYNELKYVSGVLDEVLQHSPDVLVVDDGSTDGTRELLARRTDIQLARHDRNRGYGAGLKTAYRHAIDRGYDILVTIDCDGQHEPQRIPTFVETCLAEQADIVSGSRYLQSFAGDSTPPEPRRRINAQLTAELNQRLGLKLTDAFCGFKAYRVGALSALLEVRDEGYAMPLEAWVRAVAADLRIVELPVPLIYLDETRSFGGSLDDADTRLAVYRQVLERALRETGLGGETATGTTLGGGERS